MWVLVPISATPHPVQLLANGLGNAEDGTQVFGPLSLMWNTWMCLALAFGLALRWLVQSPGEWTSRWVTCLYASHSFYVKL